jgi:hypothetical protein
MLFSDLMSPRERADQEAKQYLLKVRNRMARANRAVRQQPVPAKLTAANLCELKSQMQASLVKVNPKYADTRLSLTELVTGF